MTLSLARRLSLSSTIVLIFFFGITGVALEYNFQNTLKAATQERLRLHTYAILSVAEEINQRLLIPKKLHEAAFNQVNSGLLAFVVSNERELWRSISAKNLDIYYGQPINTGDWFFGHYRTEEGKYYFVSKYGVSWETTLPLTQAELSYTVIVMESMEPFTQSLLTYRWQVAAALCCIALILLIAQGVNLRWGLAPLRKLAKDLKKIDSGNSDGLTGQYPSELTTLTSNLNLLLANERRQRERYRNTLSDLSHSLKTPLAVMQGLQREYEISQRQLSAQEILDAVNKQINRMDNIVSYQLQRAVTFGESVSITATPVGEVANLVLDALAKVYSAKMVRVIAEFHAEAFFYGDKNDLFELLGNLCDNAFKMCVKTVRVVTKPSTEKGSAAGLIILIEDDGKGVAAVNRETILKRGVRLDSVSQGQGIGLAVVVDIMNSYQGTIAISTSDLGGATFSLMVPSR